MDTTPAMPNDAVLNLLYVDHTIRQEGDLRICARWKQGRGPDGRPLCERDTNAGVDGLC
jgi:hypothetical protein